MLKETQRWPYASAHRQTPRSPSVSAQHGERWCTNWPGGDRREVVCRIWERMQVAEVLNLL